MNSKEKITQKQALSALHRLYWAYLSIIPISQYEQEKALFNEVDEAIGMLAYRILGPPIVPLQRPYLCDFCHSAYHEYSVQEKIGQLSRSCCGPCKNVLLAEGKLLAINGCRIVQQEEGEG